MKLFAHGLGWVLYQGDALEALPVLRARGLQADIVLTDPPYSSGGAFRGDRAGDVRRKYLQHDSGIAARVPEFVGDTRDQRAHTLWLGEVLARATDCLAPSAPALVFADWRQIGATEDALQFAGLVLRGVVPWLKPDHACRPQLGRFRQSSEFVIWGSKGPWPTERPGIGALPGDYTAAAPRGEAREYATEKPVDGLLEPLLAICVGGGVVLDPFAGSGTTGIAALRTGRSCVLVEATEAGCAIAARRLLELEGAA